MATASNSGRRWGVRSVYGPDGTTRILYTSACHAAPGNPGSRAFNGALALHEARPPRRPWSTAGPAPTATSASDPREIPSLAARSHRRRVGPAGLVHGPG